MRLYISAVLAIVVAAPIAAQGPAPAGMRPVTHSTQVTSHRSGIGRDSLPKTHWDLGFGIGAGLGFLGGLSLQAVYSGLCEGSDCGHFQPLAFLVPMVLLGIIGGLIGSAFPKS